MRNIHKPTVRIIVILLLLAHFFVFGEIVTPKIVFAVTLLNTSTTDGFGGGISVTTNVPGGTFYMINEDYVERLNRDLTIEDLERAVTTTPKQASSLVFELSDTAYPLSAVMLKSGNYSVVVVDDGGNIIAKSTELATITQIPNKTEHHQLSSIKVLGRDISDFNRETLYYTVKLSKSDILKINNDYMTAVTATTVDPESGFSKSAPDEPNTIVIRPYKDFDMATRPYAVTIVELEEVAPPDSDLTPDEKIVSTNEEINRLIRDQTDKEVLRSQVVKNLDQILSAIDEVEDSETAQKAYLAISQTMTSVSESLNKIDNSQLIIDRISNITRKARKLVVIIDNPVAVSKLTAVYFTSLKSILGRIEPSNFLTKNLKNKVHDLGIQAVRSTSVYKVPSNQIFIAGSRATVQFNQNSIFNHLIDADVSFNRINSAMLSLIGTSDPRKIKRGLILHIDRPTNINEINVELEKTLLNTIRLKGREKLSLNTGEAELTFATNVLNTRENTLFMNSKFNNLMLAPPPSGVLTISNGVIFDISMKSELRAIKTFESPISLSLDISNWNLASLSEEERQSKLSIFVYNDSTRKWDTLGGNYDPITETVQTYRMKLSKYTVMQTDKAFSDLEYSWAKDEINELLGKGILDEATVFSPKTSVTRDDFTTWIARSYGLEKDALVIPFVDVLGSNTHYIEISTAYDQGVISGKSDTLFDPDGYITREEISTIVSNALTILEDYSYNPDAESNLVKYSDYPSISSWAIKTVALVDELGIMRGDDVSFRPKDYVTREEAASIVKRIYP